MRMTNKIMQNNSLYNINNNKVLQDKLSTMMATQKKITRPSDDPVIAIRALRLRTSVSELTQYYEKNAPDAESWLDVTTKALENTIAEVLTDMNKTANKAANKEYGREDLAVFVEQLKSLRNEFYSTGNLDYAGRYVFTGYRTDTPLTFMNKDLEGDNMPSYEITEQTTIESFDSINYTNTAGLDGLNKNNLTDSKYNGIEEKYVENNDIHRLRLSYDDLAKGKDIGGLNYVKDGKIEELVPASQIETVSLSDDPNPYETVVGNAKRNIDADPTAIVFIPETGEILFGDEAYKDLAGKLKTDTEIQVTYTKDSWKDGDLRPEHYFACKKATKDENGNPGKPIDYNPEYLTNGNTNKQVIEYDVGYNQKIQVNTTADKVFIHALDRDIDDLERALKDLVEIDATKTDLDLTLKGMNRDDNPTEYDKVKNQYDAAVKSYDYIRENIHTMFEGTITKTQNYLDKTNLAITDNGTRSQRLELIGNRLMDQRTNFKTLQSENEDIDIAEVIIQLTSTELTYNSALMATGKIMQTSLMNYI